jgi:hypothetical protein
MMDRRAQSRLTQLPGRAFRRVAVGALAAALAACASSASSSHGAAASEPRSSRYVLLSADMAKVKADNVYDAIAKLRPEFLRGHAEMSSFVKEPVLDTKGSGAAASTNTGAAVVTAPQPVVAYRDNARLGSVEDLKQMPLAGITEIRYIPGPEAGVKYGTNHSGGVILVKSK